MRLAFVALVSGLLIQHIPRLHSQENPGVNDARSAGEGSGEQEQTEAAPENLLRVLTYNVSIRSFLMPERAQFILDSIKQAEPDVIALQEVTPAFFDAIVADEDFTESYKLFPDKRTALQGRLLFASKLPVLRARAIALPGRSGRFAQVTTVQAGDRRLNFTNIQLESAPWEVDLRILQLRTLRDHHGINSIVLGDFSFGDGLDARREAAALPTGHSDAWQILHPEEPGHTYSHEMNVLALRYRYAGERSQRMDRILFNIAGWEVKDIQMFGVEAALEFESRRVPPSDHFGLLAEFRPE